MEAKLKQELIDRIGGDFELVPEVPGTAIISRVPVRIDYLAFPKPHLTEMGFPAKSFGIEVKHLRDFHNHGKGKKAKLIHQAITYMQSSFEINAEIIRPDFIALYTGDHKGNKKWIMSTGSSDWNAMMKLAFYFRILEFDISRRTNWKLVAMGGTFFSQLRGLGNLNFPG